MYSKKIQALIEWDEALHRSAGIDARGTDKAWQQLPTHDGSIEQRPKEWNLGFITEKLCSDPATVRADIRELMLYVKRLGMNTYTGCHSEQVESFQVSEHRLSHQAFPRGLSTRSFKWQIMKFPPTILHCHSQKWHYSFYMPMPCYNAWYTDVLPDTLFTVFIFLIFHSLLPRSCTILTPFCF